MSVSLPVADLHAFCGLAARGAVITYHRGLIMRDVGDGPPVDRTHNQLLASDIKCAAWDAYLHGYVTLIQRKHAEFDYSYLAVKR